MGVLSIFQRQAINHNQRKDSMTTDSERIVWAFPWKMGEYECTGMTLRDYFAAKALQGMLSAGDRFLGNDVSSDRLVRDAYEWADGMMEARKEVL